MGRYLIGEELRNLKPDKEMVGHIGEGRSSFIGGSFTRVGGGRRCILRGIASFSSGGS